MRPAAIPAAVSPNGAVHEDSINGIALPNNVQRACPVNMSAEVSECFALYREEQQPNGMSPQDMRGYLPADLQSAYQLPSASAGAGQTIALVDAFDDPEAESDLAVYRSTFGMPECSTANGCFRKVNQLGQPGPLPRPNPGWGVETSLDLDMVSAGCPNCNILLVEANDERSRNLARAADRAARMGVDAVSNSYGTLGNRKTWGLYKFYYHRHPVIVASAGDSKYGVQTPAGFPNVVAVGGTTLKRTQHGRGWRETVWYGTGSGCFTKALKPTWQTDHGCKGRTMNDVAAVADPDPGVAVYDSFQHQGWIVAGGTSVAAPLIASIYGLAGNGGTLTNAAALLWAPGASLYDVTSGSNGSCTKAYLCNGEVGYDGPSGNGTPLGAGAF